jgi:hypothetical protein
VGVSVDPLGEELGPTVLPDGFMVELEPLDEPAVLPVVLPLPPMVVPLDPVAPELVPMELPPPIPAAPPPAPPAPPPPPPACANAKVEPRVRIEAKAIVLSFMRCPFVLRQDNERLPFIVPKPSGTRTFPPRRRPILGRNVDV